MNIPFSTLNYLNDLSIVIKECSNDLLTTIGDFL